MLLEALVLSVCAQGSNGCSQATSAYYEQSKDLQDLSRRIELIGKNLAQDHQWVVYVATPAYELVAHQPVKLFVHSGTTMTLDPFNKFVGLQWSY